MDFHDGNIKSFNELYKKKNKQYSKIIKNLDIFFNYRQKNFI